MMYYNAHPHKLSSYTGILTEQFKCKYIWNTFCLIFQCHPYIFFLNQDVYKVFKSNIA